MTNECEAVQQRYARRDMKNWTALYSPLLPHSYLSMQEKERALIRWIYSCGIAPVESKTVLEIGCGSGNNLLDLMRLGFRPENLAGNELLKDRWEAARRRLPDAVRIIPGDACRIDPSAGTFDIILQSTVFTSILDGAFQRKLADRMWSLANLGVLWYDFTFDNPRNPDVRGVPLRRVRELFPEAQITSWRITLAPPISRLVCRIHPGLYHVFNVFPWLRTHVLCWIAKK
jgi:SAM-dependent methyltransferase